MGLEAIGDGLKTRLQTIPRLRVFAPKELPDSINQFPTALILPGETLYVTAFDGDCDYNFRILVVLTKQDQPSALNALLDYIEVAGVKSVVAAIYGDLTLGGAADTCRVPNNSGVGAISWGGYTYLGTEFAVQCWV